MKKLRLLLCGLMVAGMAFTSCSDDDGESTPVQQASIEGKWFFSQRGVSIAGQDQLSNWTGHTQGCSKDNMVFGPNNSYAIYYYESGTCDEEVIFTSNYTVDGNMLTTGETGAEVIQEIESITENNLRLRRAVSTGGQTYYEVETYTRN